MPHVSSTASPTIWTIGHSNRSLAALVELLRGEQVGLVADVRRFPSSRAHPQFNREAFEQGLAEAGIGYRHFPELGGRRNKRAANSANTAWRVDAFNAFADYMQTAEFAAGLERLIAAARSARAAILCAEALPWQCHRRLIADALIARGWTVLEIISAAAAKPHQPPAFARIEGSRVTYPGDTLF
jgi:uncharacterized protein (DUF488 family)